MILIADSGSTKTQWILVNKNHRQLLVNTPGINPFFQRGEEIESTIRPLLADIDCKELTAIYYFGAGCAMPDKKELVGTSLFNVFKCKYIVVDSDIIGGCLALLGDKSGIVCLMGTGSNSCLWDGEKIAFQVPSLGYILGDEGSGASIGRQLIADFLKNQMPLPLRLKFIEQYSVSAEIAIERVYRMPFPNRYLAGFAPFAEKYIDTEYCHNLIYNQFNQFVKRNLLQYNNVESYKICFNGSIAHFHRDILATVFADNGLTLGEIIKEPIELLADYFQRKTNHFPLV